MYEDFVLSIEKLRKLCIYELSKRKIGISGESSVNQLEQIVKELDELLLKIKSENIPPQSNRFLNTFAYAFKDWGWNMQNPTDLYILLCRVNTAYQNLE